MKSLLSMIVIGAIVPSVAFAHQVKPDSDFTSEPWQSYGLEISEEKEVAINTIRFEQQRQRFEITKEFTELCSKRTKSEARKIAGFVHLMRG